jgi:4-amino-4-deoxy-L-arabinose transferase-like glycosyltransferase
MDADLTTSQHRAAEKARRRPAYFCAALLLLLFAGLSVWEMAGDSVTSDERFHLPAGYAYWKKQEFRLNPEHPPLVKLLAAAPLLTMDLKMPPTLPDLEKYREPSEAFNEYEGEFGSEFLFTQDADRLIFLGRLPVVGLSLVLGLFIFQWSRMLHGSHGAGLLSLFLFALEPTMIAHGHYVTTDVALACFSIMAMFYLWRFSREGKLRHFFFASLSLGLGLAAKFSALFLVPVFFLLLFWRWPAPENPAKTGSSIMRHGGLARTLAAIAAMVVFGATVQACYLFSSDLTLYFQGIQSLVFTQGLRDRPPYLLGRFIAGGVWWYPLYAVLLKTPLPTLIVILTAGLAALKERRSLPGDSLFVLLPAAVMTLATCVFARNLGVRYMIPATAFLLVFAGRSWFTFSSSWRGKTLGAALAVWLVISVLRVSPHYISYFNESVGGPENGADYLDDSNIDWGQDLKRLAQYLSKNGIDEAVLSFWGPTPPAYYGEQYGVRFKPWTAEAAASDMPPPGIYAISINNLTNIKLLTALRKFPDSKRDWLSRFKPSDRVGYSIYIYKFPQSG